MSYLTNSSKKLFLPPKPHRPNRAYVKGELMWHADTNTVYISVDNVPENISHDDTQYWRIFQESSVEEGSSPEEPELESQSAQDAVDANPDLIAPQPIKMWVLLACCFGLMSFILLLSILLVTWVGFHVEIPIYALTITLFTMPKMILRLLGVRKTLGHTHKDAHGYIVRCYHQCKSVLLNPAFWIGMTLGYPFEHTLWEQVWPFYLLSDLLHLLHH